MTDRPPKRTDTIAQVTPLFFHEPTPWMADAACRTYPTIWWFPERGQEVERAKTICYTCPVRLDCLNYALNIPGIVGIWGGTSGKERRDIGKPNRPKPIRHGTTTGYHQHLARKEAACTACLQANREATRRRAARRRLIKAAPE